MTLQPRACFACRKCFKKSEESAKCPQCGGPLVSMGTAFRAPKQTDVAQWKKAEELVRAGLLFHRHAGPRPETLRELPDFLEAKQNKTTVAKRATPAKSQGRITAVEVDGRQRFTLAGRALESWCMVEVMNAKRWTRGVFRSGPPPRIQTDCGMDVPVGPNTVCRWPQR